MDMNSRYYASTSCVYPWFKPQWDRVVQLHKQQKLPHALVLNGSAGIGKLHLASHIAQLVLCAHRQDDNACGTCRSCTLFSSSGHPDLYHLSPEDEGGQIKVDQVRELTKFMQGTAQQGGYRVVILNPAESMNLAASNALLKTLEEPGKDSLLLLVSHQLGQVMPTIKSRCQRLDCAIPEASIAQQWLMEQLQIEQASAEQLLNVVHGAPLTGLHFKEQGSQALRGQLFTGLKAVLQNKTSALELSQQLAKLDVPRLLSWFYSLLVDVSKRRLVGEGSTLVNNDMSNMILALAKRTNIQSLYQLSDKVHQRRAALLQHQNPNKQLMLEELLLDWKNLIIND